MKIIDDNDLATTHGKNGTPPLEVISVEAGPAAAEQPGHEDDKLAPRDRMIERLKHIRERLVAYAAQSSSLVTLPVALLAAAESLDTAITAAKDLPADWRPVRGAISPDFVIGTRVLIKARHRAAYQGDLSADEMDDMVIQRLGEKRVRCQCVTSGVLAFVPAGHLEHKGE